MMTEYHRDTLRILMDPETVPGLTPHERQAVAAALAAWKSARGNVADKTIPTPGDDR